MLNRRELLRSGLAASALSGIPISVALAAPSFRPASFLVDSQLPDAAAMSAQPFRIPTTVQFFVGDPGQLWMNTIEPVLRVNPVVIAGYTSAPTLFCLQYLTRDYGLMLEACVTGARSLDAITERQSQLVDLRDARFSDPRAAYTWVLAPRKG